VRSPFAERERERLIAAILPDVAFDGWTVRALRRAARRLDMPEGEAVALFPRGAPDMIAAFSHWADREMLERLEKALAEPFDPLPDPAPPPPSPSRASGGGKGGGEAAAGRVGVSLSRRVALALRLRFEAMLPWREAVRRGLAVLTLPHHAPLALRLLYDTVDAIWRGVGDRSTDFSFYTKRATLAGISAAAMLYWLDDRSPEFADTQAFIDRRLADLHRFGDLRGRAAAARDRLPNPFRLLRPVR
jgi:ubiquinone biosynthesis protein COQ9